MRLESTRHDGDFRLDPTSRRAATRTIGPARLDDHLLELRRPRLSDGPAWRHARLAAEERLAGTFADGGSDWRDSCSLTTYADLWWHQRRGVAAGLLVPYLAVRDGNQVVGELTFAIAPRTGVAEASLWASSDLAPSEVTWIAAAGVLRLFSLPQRLSRIVAPVAIDNPGPARLLQQFGFVHHGVARRLRPHRGRVVDHDLWWLERDEEHLRGLGALVAAQLV